MDSLLSALCLIAVLFLVVHLLIRSNEFIPGLAQHLPFPGIPESAAVSEGSDIKTMFQRQDSLLEASRAAESIRAPPGVVTSIEQQILSQQLYN